MYGEGGNKRNLVMMILGLICFLGAAILLHSYKGQFGQESVGRKTVDLMPVMEDTIDVSPSASVSNPSQLSSVTQATPEAVKEEWIIYITGSVKKPGVYRVPIGSRVYQALEAAGGFASQADQEAVNLAAILQDGAHVTFPAKGEAAPRQVTAPTNSAAPSSGIATEGLKATAELIDLNTAGKEDLEKLPGVGPKTAQLIIDYREKNGTYKRAEDLLLIKGIGPAKYDAVKNLVTIGQ